ncbi:hypothetical protein E9232_001126 [Inquilinus ginsengisoli]|uniref:AAA+ ATPase domain-containing protein n=1 Tax=Inquilinus ginsengisoli TaxID=363840 RepID=A0ABU1JM38_9PROT|nr:helicase RepA family protein [Inquilinus ginsengisoli]MDR6288619.1 hypothetical protein [Inquilinus ginsengisoli]
MTPDHDDSNVRTNISSSVSPGPLPFVPWAEMEIGNVFSIQSGKPIDLPAGKQPRSLPVIDWPDIVPQGEVLTLVRGLLAPNSLAMIYGPSNVGKSFAALDLATSVAASTPWRGLDVDGGTVIYVGAEGAHGLRRRVEAIRRHRGITGALPFSLVPVALNLTAEDRADATALIGMTKAAVERFGQPAKLIIVDTVHRCFAGAEENSASDMGRFLANVDYVREKTGAAVLLIHHSGKDETRGARGSSALRAAVDTELAVSADEDGTIRMTLSKQKDGASEGEFAMTLHDVEIGEDDDGEQMLAPVVQHVDVPPAKKKTGKLNDRQALGLRALHNHFAGTDRDTVDFGTFKTILVQRGVLEEGSNPALFTRLRQQLERLGKIYYNSGQIGLTKSGQKL